jgi:hypothetical protein
MVAMALTPPLSASSVFHSIPKYSHYYHIPVNIMARRMRGGTAAARRRCEGYESIKCVAVSSVLSSRHVFILHRHF